MTRSHRVVASIDRPPVANAAPPLTRVPVGSTVKCGFESVPETLTYVLNSSPALKPRPPARRGLEIEVDGFIAQVDTPLLTMSRSVVRSTIAGSVCNRRRSASKRYAWQTTSVYCLVFRQRVQRAAELAQKIRRQRMLHTRIRDPPAFADQSNLAIERRNEIAQLQTRAATSI